MASSSSSSHSKKRIDCVFSGIEPPGIRRKASDSTTRYDVFINHRGPDSKQTLALPLYKSLKKLGIRAFLDKEEMELGQYFRSAIESAISSALVHIAIISKRYAESPWCLEELILMQQTEAKIIPVFYGVEPSEVRHIEEGAYADAFIQYQKNLRYLEKLDGWKKALRSISFTAGHEIKDLNDYERIVIAVQKEVQIGKPLHVAKYPVALDKLVQDFERRCLEKLVQDFEIKRGQNERKGKAEIVGIFGMGGVGKTTLCKEFFNRKRRKYDRACFLFDVREASARSKLPSLQKQLLKDLFDVKGPSFQSREGGSSSIFDHIERSKFLSFLIVLDDINHLGQLETFMIMDMLKKPGNSLVIISTRDVGVLERAGIEVCYHLQGMDKVDSRVLFSLHAFSEPHPATGYEDLVDAFLRVCGGLPLSLKVLGRHVHNQAINYWRKALDVYGERLHLDIKQILKISYDALETEEKQIFIDIACFFVDNLTDTAVRVWKASGWKAEYGLQKLKDRCLVEEINDSVPILRMHNHLRDLGREMANEPSHPPRLWRPRDLKNLEPKGFENILIQTKRRCFHSFFDESLKSRITFLLGELDDSAAISTPLLLLQLDVEGYLSDSIPSWIPLQNMRCCTINGGRFNRLWRQDVQLPLQLRELRITKCFGVSSLPEGFGALQRLEHLELTFCPILASLPPDFGDLRNLRHLDLSNCEQLEELPHSFEQLIYLEYIRLSGCTMLSSLPLRFGDLRNLRHLDLSNCEQLEELPHSFQQLTGLKYLTLSCCWKLKLSVDMLKNITELQYLGLTGCNLLEELPRLVTVFPLQLRELRITRCFLGSFLPEEFCTLKSLEILELSCCPMLSSLPPRFGDLRNLRYLDLSCCLKLKLKLDMLENITTLEYLNLTRLHEMKELPYHTINQASLTRLFVEGTSISEVPTDIGELRNLEELRIGSPMLTSLPSSLGKLSCLTTLLIDGCPQLQDLPQSLCNLDLLKQVRIRASGLRELPFGAGSSNFEVTGQQAEAAYSGLNLRPRVTENCLRSIWNALKALWIERRVTEHGILETDFPTKLPAGIQTMSLVANPRLMEIRILPQSLTIFEIRVCKMLKNLSGIVGLVKLRRLEICSCPELDELPSFADLASLQEFKIQGCPKVKIIQGVEHCTSLQILTAEVPVIQSLENVEGLRRVNLTSYTISDLKPCILSIKKCPREMMIRGRVTPFVKPIVDFLSLTNLSVLLLDKDSDWDNITGDLFSGAFLWYEEEEESNNEESGSSSVNVSAQKVVQVAVCREGSSAFPEYLVERRFGSNPNFRQRRAMLATGEDGRVVAAFRKLIALLE